MSVSSAPRRGPRRRSPTSQRIAHHAGVYLDDAATASRAVAAGITTSRVLIDACIERYEQREPALRAFAWFDAARARRLADAADRSVARRETLGHLHGVPVGIKDIIDTAGIPTEHGSRLFAGRVPERDARLVTNLRTAGAVDVGKTVTAEFAFYAPGPTTNPHDPNRTPGGSSMGSAAAVAAGVIPVAVGTQTNGSIIRPAAFCGAVGFKPSFGRISRDGVLEFSASLDTVGGFARTVESAASLAAAMAGEPVASWWNGPRTDPPRLAAVRTSEWGLASDAMQARFQADVDRLATAGGAIEWPALPDGLDDAVQILGTIMRYEGARSVGRDALRRPELVSEVARRFFAEGLAIDEATYRAALAHRLKVAAVYAAWAERYDAILTPPTTGEAPGLETTGDPRFCTRWTLVGAPVITLPTGSGPSGLPLGLQLVGVPERDRDLLGAAAWAEAVLAVHR